MPTEPFPEIVQWLETIEKRSAVERGVNVPEKFTLKEKLKSKEETDAYAKMHSQWIMKGMNDDADKHK